VQKSHADIRDLHLLGFAPQAVDSIEVTGLTPGERFLVQRQTNNGWAVTEPVRGSVDTNAMSEWMDQLARLEGTVEKDVVTDFSTPYGLATPARSYILRSAVTNASGVISNRTIAQLDLGMVPDRRVYVRRPDEATVYSLSKDVVARLPREPWQLRDRRVWSFTTNDISRVTVHHGERTRTLQRSPSGTWSIVEGSGVVASINPALEETMYRLGNLRAGTWAARGEEKRVPFGFVGNTSKITIELRNGDKPVVRTLEFGRPGISPSGIPYTLTEIDGQTLVFEITPMALQFQIVRDLLNPLAAPAE
jgi:Domain of unknown function (DUF4340)